MKITYPDEPPQYGEIIKRNDVKDDPRWVVEFGDGKREEVSEGRITKPEDGSELVPGIKVEARRFRKPETAILVARITTRQTYDIRLDSTEEINSIERWVEPFDDAEVAPRKIKTAPNAKLHHFRPSTQQGTNAGEYVRPGTGPINITSHGLGSGIYGLADPNESHHSNAKANVGQYEVDSVSLDNPLVVQDRFHGSDVVALGLAINEAAQEVADRLRELDPDKSHQGSVGEVAKAVIEERGKDLATKLTNVFEPLGKDAPGTDLITEAIVAFMSVYRDEKVKFADQPVTVFLRDFCQFDGIYGDEDSGLNGFGKGSVKYVQPDVKMLRKVRDGSTHLLVEMS